MEGGKGEGGMGEGEGEGKVKERREEEKIEGEGKREGGKKQVVNSDESGYSHTRQRRSEASK